MSREKPQADTINEHPDRYQDDLNPNAMAGQNIGMGEAQPSKDARTAHDIKEAHQRLSYMTDDNLKQIPILPEGARLQQGATYVDLHDLGKGEFTAMGGMAAEARHAYVAKADVPYHLWNVLLGVDNPERLADSTDAPTSET